MTNMDEAIRKAEGIEHRIAGELINIGRMLASIQCSVQPDAVAILNAALRSAAELKIEIVLGAMPVIRLVALDGGGEEITLLRQIEFAAVPNAAH